MTTPESLYLLLTSERSRHMLRTVRTVIVDEIHAVIGTRRGAHLALSLERLQHVADRPLLRLGLSATQKPIARRRALALRERRRPLRDRRRGPSRGSWISASRCRAPTLDAVMSHEVWEEYYDRLADLVQAHRTTLIFVNTRRLAERLARHLSDRLGEEAVTAHHGSLSKEKRLDAETRLKSGRLRALVATASLELGIDIGHVDLVCQIGSPHRIATLLQRVGRSGHTVAGTPKGRLFPMSRDDLVECAALLRSVRRGELDAIVQHDAPLDVLAQQIVAEAACATIGTSAEDGSVRARPARVAVSRPRRAAEFDAVVDDGGRRLLDPARAPRRAAPSRRSARHRARPARRAAAGADLGRRDSGGRRLPRRARPGRDVHRHAQRGLRDREQRRRRLSARERVVAHPAGDRGTVRVADAKGAPPTIPFWLGEAPARSDELSRAVSDLARDGRSPYSARIGPGAAWLVAETGLTPDAAAQAVAYLTEGRRVLGAIPTQETLVLERFFDESGGMQLVLHAPFGSRINKAWGLALRKRFCRQFNFELQAAATEDALLLSLGPQHSFPLADVFRYLHPETTRDVLVQAFLDAPVFKTRWRWNTTISLAVPRARGGRRVAPQLQRMLADDLMAAVFPDAAACLENIPGDRQIPDHPLVDQTVRDCLQEAMDFDGLHACSTHPPRRAAAAGAGTRPSRRSSRTTS